MSKTIKQYRYYGDNNVQNQPSNINKINMSTKSGNIFISNAIIQELGMITNLGIQGLPGTKIYINNNPSPILLGMMGVFELNLTDYSFIYSLQVDYDSAALIERAEDGYLIIDTIYDTEV